MPLKHLRCLLLFIIAFAFDGTVHAQQDSRRTRNPHGPIEIACQNCHASESWKPIRRAPDFDHNRQTLYPLRGAHTAVGCTGCHVQPVFKNASQTCASCHADIHRRQFGAGCENCHTVQGWRVQTGSVQRHLNRFPLAGAHSAAACESCHRGAASGVFTGLSTACASCHASDYQRARTIDHRAAGFNTSCETCHSLSQWRGARFDHNTATQFPLRGAHSTTSCSSCHSSATFTKLASDCFSCHAADFNSTVSPNHRASGISTDCAKCHSETGWKGTAFDHNATRFPLTGAHANTGCTTCHVNGQFSATPQACMGCHASAYNATTNPNHVAAGFPQECSICHSTAKWTGAVFDHNARTQFALTGAHSSAPCIQCHAGNRFAGTPKDCASCHGTLYERTTNPNHVAAAFPRDCALCHATSAWKPAQFDHSRTRFPLTGAHTAATCVSCHASGLYGGLSASCASCHINKYNTTTNPNHLSAGFPQDCQICHTTTQWKGATFNHNTTRFALTGAHITVQCANCHIAGRYAGTPMDCYSCHSREFTTVTNPNHIAAGFPKTCETCHTTSQWSGARFSHKFPIYSGSHAGKWSTCNDCHTNTSNYTVFSCINCHEHDKSKMDPKHREVRGYVYDSLACYGCHPTGKH